MKRMKNIFSIALLAALALQACNLKLVESPQDSDAANLELTAIVQQMLIDQAAQQGNAGTATFTPEPGNVPPTEEVVIPAAVLPPATGDVTVTVSVATNCRTGPGQAYPSVYGLPVGVTGKVVGKNPSVSNYWVIEIPNTNGGTCWLWGQYATVTGDTSGLKVFAVPATPTPTKTNTPTPTKTSQPTATNTTAAAVAPAAPAILASSVVCSDAGGGNQKYAFEVTWADKSDNETMFVITTSVNGLFSKGPNVTFFAFSETLPAGTTLTLNLVAQNATGSSAPVSTTFVCP